MKRKLISYLLSVTILSATFFSGSAIAVDAPPENPSHHMDLPVYSSIEEAIESNSEEFLINPNPLMRSPYETYHYTLLQTITKRNVDLGFNPNFPRTKANGYYFSNSVIRMSVSVSAAFGINGPSISVSAGFNTGSTGGSFITANPNIYTRPRMYGDIDFRKYQVTVRAVGNGAIIRTYYDELASDPYNTYHVSQAA